MDFQNYSDLVALVIKKGHRWIVYFKIRFLREDTHSNKLLVLDISFSLFKNFEFRCFHSKVEHYVCLTHFEV